MNPVALVRDTRNTPAVDSTSAAPPTLSSGDPATVTCTPEPAKRPGTTLSIDAARLGDVGDPPQALNNVASVAPDAT
jgi:hypothetical protein